MTAFPRVMYELSTFDGTENIIGKFYQEQLTLVLDQNEFVIEKILKRRGDNFLVKYLGYDKPEWVPKQNITTIKE